MTFKVSFYISNAEYNINTIEADTLENAIYRADVMNAEFKANYVYISNTDDETLASFNSNGWNIYEDNTYEETHVCVWCGEEFAESELDETDMGWMCEHCQLGIMSRGEKLRITR